MKARRKRLVAVLVMFCIVSALAIFFSTLLGKAYLGIMNSGETKTNPQPAQDVVKGTEVTATKTAEITPVSVFYLQGGIYNDVEGARKAAEDFIAVGVEPYITGEAPYRLYIGFFGKREGAEILKDYLAEKELSAFIQSQVLNAKPLTYSASKEPLVRKWVPLLEESSMVFKDLEKGTDFGIFDLANKSRTMEDMQARIESIDKLIKDVNTALPEQGQFGDKVQELADSLTNLRDNMKMLQTEWNQHNYDLVSKGFMDFLGTYNQCFHHLLEPEKT